MDNLGVIKSSGISYIHFSIPAFFVGFMLIIIYRNIL
jgi:ABC-type dipeptide/oligopeptide/nickel transport system permease component